MSLKVGPDIEEMWWTEYHMMVHKIAKQVRENLQVQQIVALGRGGFVPGAHLSNLLDVPLVPLMWQTRDGEIQEKITTDLNTLIVDDINDSGKTLRQVIDYNTWNGSLWTAVLVNKTWSSFTNVDYIGMTSDNSNWISFPWER